MPVAIQVQVKGREEFARALETIRKRGGRVGDACFQFAQAVAIQDRANAQAKGGDFWNDQAAQVVARPTATGAAVYINYIGAHWQEGGDIFPDTKRCLTIPVSDEAKGKRAGDFEMGGRQLFTLDIEGDPDTIGLLGYAEEDGSFHPLYLLRTRVHHEPDPWLATDADITRIGRRELRRFADSLTEGL